MIGKSVLLGVVVLVSTGVGCGGSSTTTIIEQAPTTTVSTTTVSTAASPQGAYISDLTTGKRTAQPSEFSFAVDGDLVGRDLQWSAWGTPTATATGNFDFTQPPTHRKQRRSLGV